MLGFLACQDRKVLMSLSHSKLSVYMYRLLGNTVTLTVIDYGRKQLYHCCYALVFGSFAHLPRQFSGVQNVPKSKWNPCVTSSIYRGYFISWLSRTLFRWEEGAWGHVYTDGPM